MATRQESKVDHAYSLSLRSRLDATSSQSGSHLTDCQHANGAERNGRIVSVDYGHPVLARVSDSSTSDEVFGDGMARLGNGLQNWVTVNFRRARLGMCRPPRPLVCEASG